MKAASGGPWHAGLLLLGALTTAYAVTRPYAAIHASAPYATEIVVIMSRSVGRQKCLIR